VNEDTPRMAKSGRSFDWRGKRWRCEAAPGDPVKDDVAFVAAAIAEKLEREHGYVVVDIGCLECGESSHLVGIVADRDEAITAGAQHVLDSRSEAEAAWWGGSGLPVAFKIDGDWSTDG